MPTIAVVMPFYRDDRWFPEALASVLNQTRPPDEVIVVDDGSGADRATSLVGLSHPVRVIHLEQNGGPGRARQTGTEAASSELIAFIDSDDRWRPTFLAACEAALVADPAVAAVYAGIATFRPDGTMREHVEKPAELDIREALVRFHAFPALGMLFRRGALLAAGGWDVRRLAVDDWDLMARFLDRHGPIRLVPAVLAEYRLRHEPGRLNSQGLRKLWRFWNTVNANRELLARHYGKGAARRRFAQAVRDRADHHRGLAARGYLVASRLIGRPLDLDLPRTGGSA